MAQMYTSEVMRLRTRLGDQAPPDHVIRMFLTEVRIIDTSDSNPDDLTRSHSSLRPPPLSRRTMVMKKGRFKHSPIRDGTNHVYQTP